MPVWWWISKKWVGVLKAGVVVDIKEVDWGMERKYKPLCRLPITKVLIEIGSWKRQVSEVNAILREVTVVSLLIERKLN